MSYMENYELPNSQSKYFKLQKGTNKFRILSSSINGRIDRKEEKGKRKPIRTEQQQKDFDKEKPAKHFWAFAVWNYAEELVQILEITQRGIQKTLYGLFTSDDRGDPRNYDIKIEKKGEGLTTEYVVSPLPSKVFSKEILKQYEDMNIHLGLLFEGADPFDYKGWEERQVQNDIPF